MLFRQKLAFFVFGCVFVIVGQVVTVFVVPSARAQRGAQPPRVAEFDIVKTHALAIVDHQGLARGTLAIKDGIVKLSLAGRDQGHGGALLIEVNEAGDAALTMKAPGLSNGLKLSQDHAGVSMVQLLGGKGDTVVGLTSSPRASARLVAMRNGKAFVAITSDEHGGVIGVLDRSGESEVMLGVDESGNGFVDP